MAQSTSTRAVRRDFARRVMSLSDAQIDVYLDLDDLSEALRAEIEKRPDGIKQSLRAQLNGLLTTAAQYPAE